VRARGLCADDGDPDPGVADLRHPAAWVVAAVVRADVRLHHGESGGRPVHLDAGADPGAGDAAELLLHAPEHPAERLHLSADGDAGAGAVDRAALAAYLLSRCPARDPVEGRGTGDAVEAL